MRKTRLRRMPEIVLSVIDDGDYITRVYKKANGSSTFSSVVIVIKKLTKLGFITKEEHGRKTLLRYTKKGKALREEFLILNERLKDIEGEW